MGDDETSVFEIRWSVKDLPFGNGAAPLTLTPDGQLTTLEEAADGSVNRHWDGETGPVFDHRVFPLSSRRHVSSVFTNAVTRETLTVTSDPGTGTMTVNKTGWQSALDFPMPQGFGVDMSCVGDDGCIVIGLSELGSLSTPVSLLWVLRGEDDMPWTVPPPLGVCCHFLVGIQAAVGTGFYFMAIRYHDGPSNWAPELWGPWMAAPITMVYKFPSIATFMPNCRTTVVMRTVKDGETPVLVVFFDTLCSTSAYAIS